MKRRGRPRSIRSRASLAGPLRLEGAEFLEEPVQRLGRNLVDVAVSFAGNKRPGWRGQPREVLHFLAELLGKGRQVVGPVLQLILPKADELCGRIPESLRAQVGREPLLQGLAVIVGNAGLMEEKKQQALVQIG